MSTTPSSESRPTAAVLLIGNELLSGRTVDRNLSYMGEKLAARGIRLAEARVVEDQPDAIIAALNHLRASYRYVFTTGGIGPTHDDITADCVADAFGVALPIHEGARQLLAELCEARGLELNDDRLRMARIPEGARLIDNTVSAAPGFTIGNVFVMAGVPSIMQAMFDSVLPTLDAGAPILSVTVTGNLPEGQMASALRQLQEGYPHIDIGSYPGRDANGYRGALVARGEVQAELDEVADKLRVLITSLGGELLD